MTSRISAVTMPKWGMTMTEGKLARWLVAAGDQITAGSAIAEIETTKITNVLEASAPGVVRRIVTGDGATTRVGSLLAIIAPPDVPDAEIDAYIAAHTVAADDDGDADLAGASARIVPAGPHRINVLSLGAGPATPVVLVHGFGGDLNSWMFNQPVLAGTRPAHALDLPGHGQSPAAIGSGSARSLSQAVLAMMDALEIQRAHLVGHSMGGAIALLLAIAKPERVASVTGVAPGGLGPALNKVFIDDFIAAQTRKSMQTALELLFGRPDAVSRGMIDEALKYKRQDGTTEALAAIAAANFTADGQKSGLRELLPTIRTPVQIIWGRHDKIIPVDQASGLPPAIPVTILENAGHMPHMEQASETNRLIAGFVAQFD